MNRLTASVAIFAVCSTSAVALAGGYEVGENGTRSLGRAGAYVVGVDEPSAVYYNPSALTRIDGTAFTLNLNLVDSNTTFQREDFTYEADTRRDPERVIHFDEVSQQNPLFPAPMAFLSHDFGLDNWTFGVGAYGPSSFGAPRYPDMSRRTADFSGDPCGLFTPCADDRNTDLLESEVTRDGGQSYMITEQNVLVVYPSLSAAHFFEEANLSVGLTAQLALLFVDFTVGVDGDGSQSTDVDFDSIERDDFFVPNTLSASGVSGTGILGITWEPTERIAVAASYRPQFGFKANGTIDIDFPPGLSGADLSLTDDSATLKLRFPDVVRAGVGYTHLNSAGREIFDVEFNFLWENWSVSEEFEVTVDGRVDDSAGTLDNRVIPTLHLPKNYNDSFAFRLGGDISALLDEEGHGPVFRLGASYETSSSPEEWTNLDFTPFARVGATLGFSYHVGRFSIDAAYAYFWSPDRTVEDGEYQLLTPLWVCNDPSNPQYPAEECAGADTDVGHAVNNGEYTTWTQIFSIGTTYGW